MMGSKQEPTPVELVPRAIISEPLTELVRRLRVKVTQGYDDLDYYESASLSFHGTPVELKHYRGTPQDETTLLMPISIGNAEAIAELIERIAREFHFPVTWHQKTDDPKYTPASVKSSKHRHR